MPSSSALRQQIESNFQHRYPSVLTPAPRTIREVHPTGIPSLDDLLNGGLPVGAITELTGPASSGRTSIALSFLSSRTREGSVCAWIDANDAFDPESAAANGVSLNHLLWVRCTSNPPSPTNHSLSKLLYSKISALKPVTNTSLDASRPGASRHRPPPPIRRIRRHRPRPGRRSPSSTPAAFLSPPGSASARPPIAPVAPSSFWAKLRVAQSSAAVVLECEHSAIESANKTVLRGFTFRASRKRERFSPITTSVTSIDRAGQILRKPPASTWSAPSAWNAARRA